MNATPAPLTRTLGEFVAGLRFGALPAEVVDKVRLGFTDCVAAIYAGARHPVTRIVTEQVGTLGLRRESRVCPDGRWAGAADATLVNATAGHALDYDDYALGGHPSVVLVPAILAEAEAVGASGAQAVAAYVAGYETWARLIEREADQYHLKGWHPTTIIGPVGAAAAIANLRGLDAERATAALAIAASLCSGVVANFGSMTKPFQVAWSSSAGVTAAQLAARGMTATPTALEDRAGLMQALSPNGNVDLHSPLRDLGRDWRLLSRGLTVKRYPMCGASHRASDAILDIAKQYDLAPEHVRSVEVMLGRTQAGSLRYHKPQTATEARFSMHFAVASILASRRLGLAEFTDDFVRRPVIQATMEKVRVVPTDGFAEDEPMFAPFDQARLSLADGTVIESPPIDHPRGHWSVPLSSDELWAKFEDCTAAEMPPTRARELFDLLQRVESLGQLRDVPVLAFGAE